MVKHSIDPLRYYHLETFLFEDVHDRFHRDGSLGAVDLFSIVIWKANRAKSRIARRLLRKHGSLEEACRTLTSSLFKARSPERCLGLLLGEWQFRLPMATAILTVLWPEEFTIYDVRVCAQLQQFQRLGAKSSASVWREYCDYRDTVDRAVRSDMPLRDKDRYLWGRSAIAQLQGDIQCWDESFGEIPNKPSQSVRGKYRIEDLASGRPSRGTRERDSDKPVGREVW